MIKYIFLLNRDALSLEKKREADYAKQQALALRALDTVKTSFVQLFSQIYVFMSDFRCLRRMLKMIAES